MITYKSNRDGSLQAAYTGTVRIGYVEMRKFNRWLYQLSLIRPGGGCYMGYEDDEESAKEELQKAFVHWIASAELQPVPPMEKPNESTRPEQELRAAEDTDKGAGRKVRRSARSKHTVPVRSPVRKRVR